MNKAPSNSKKPKTDSTSSTDPKSCSEAKVAETKTKGTKICRYMRRVMTTQKALRPYMIHLESTPVLLMFKVL